MGTKNKQTYIVNGHIFHTMNDVNNYCKINNFRITDTQTLTKNKFLIAVRCINN